MSGVIRETVLRRQPQQLLLATVRRHGKMAANRSFAAERANKLPGNTATEWKSIVLQNRAMIAILVQENVPNDALDFGYTRC